MGDRLNFKLCLIKSYNNYYYYTYLNYFRVTFEGRLGSCEHWLKPYTKPRPNETKLSLSKSVKLHV